MDEENKESKDIFSKEATIGQNQSYIVSFIVLQKWFNTLLEYELYNNMTEGSGAKEKAGERTRNSINILLIMLGTRLKKQEKVIDKFTRIMKYDEIKEELEKKDYDKTLSLIAEYLEEDLKLTKIDMRREYNLKNWGESIKAKGGM